MSTTEQLSTIDPNQDTLFDGQQYDQSQIELRQERAIETLAAIDTDTADKRLRKPLTPENELATREALDILKSPDADLPESLEVKRDWSDNLKQHEEKQQEKVAAAEKMLESRLVANDKALAREQAAQAKIAEAKAVEAVNQSRIEKTAAAKAALEADNAKRQALREEFIAKERFLAGSEPRGRDMAKIYADIDVAADKHVRAIMHPETQNDSGSVLDTSTLKKESQELDIAKKQRNQDTHEAINDFYKSFNALDTDEVYEETNDTPADATDTSLPIEVELPRRLKTSEKIDALDALEKLNKQVGTARENYARVSAGRSRRIVRFGKKYSAEAVSDAREAYEELLIAATDQESAIAVASGVDPEQLEVYASAFAIGESENLTDSLRNQRLLATGAVTRSADGEFVPVQAKGKMDKFYKWWGNQAGSKRGTAKKIAVTAAAGVVVGIPTALAGSVLLGPIAGGALGATIASKITKSTMLYRINTRADALKNGSNHADRLDDDLLDSIEAGNIEEFSDMTKLVDNQTRREVKRNRKRIGASVGAAALGGVVGNALGHEIGQHLLGTGDTGHETNHSNSSTSSTATHPAAAEAVPTTEMPAVTTGNPNLIPAPEAPDSPTIPEATAQNFSTIDMDHYGDTIWGETSQYMEHNGYKSDNGSVNKVVKAILSHENLSDADARHLPVGYKFHIPREVLESIHKNS